MKWDELHDQFNDEVDLHIEQSARDLMESGVPEQEARARARREFGNRTRVAEESRAVWIWGWLERLWQDLVYAQRILMKEPGFTAIAVLSLALGVGANCAMFSLADVLLLRPLPVPDPGELFNVGSTRPTGTEPGFAMSYPDYRDFRDRNRSFAGVAAFQIENFRFADRAGEPVELRTSMVVSGNFFDAMQVKPVLGRAFQPAEDEVPGRDAVLILGHSFWETEFASDPGVVGHAAQINGINFTIVGVMDKTFTGPDTWIHPDFYVPMMMWPRLTPEGQALLEQRGFRSLNVKGRLRPDTTEEQAKAEANVLGSALAAEYPVTNENWRFEIRTEMEKRLDGSVMGPIVVMVMLMAGAVLLVACANVASLLTSRAPARAREISLRLAIGAGRGRLVRQLLTESAMLALLGAIAGLAVGYAGVQFLKQMRVVAEVPVALSFELDERALTFSLLIGVVSVFLFGLAPALRMARTDAAGALGGEGTSGDRVSQPRVWMRNALVTSQVALSIVVLTVAAIMYLTLEKDLLEGPGFQTEHLLLASFDPSLVNYSDEQVQQFYRDLPDRVLTIPGVRSVALASGVPGGYDLGSYLMVPEGFDFPDGEDGALMVSSRVNPSYFKTLAVGIVQGRGFTAADDADARPVAVVNQVAAERYWPGQDPIGKRLHYGGDTAPLVEIVGVVENMKFNFLVERSQPAVFLPFAQQPQSRADLLLKSSGDPGELAAPLRDLIRGLDPDLPTFNVRSFADTWETNAVSPSRVIIEMIAAMGVVGVLLSLTGLYGLMAYSVSARRREIGIRMAVGARQRNVVGIFLLQGAALAGAGTLIGLLLSIGTGRLMAAAFPTHNPPMMSYLPVVPAVFLITTFAALIPARRASRVDPVAALRQE